MFPQCCVFYICILFTFSEVNLSLSVLLTCIFSRLFTGVSLAVDTPQHAKSYRGTTLSHAARTHAFKKLRAPSRCRECESYVYFQGAECQQVRAWFLVIRPAILKKLKRLDLQWRIYKEKVFLRLQSTKFRVGNKQEAKHKKLKKTQQLQERA